MRISEYIPYVRTLSDYPRAIVVFFGLLFLFRVIFYIGERILIRWVSKTKTDIDDILMEKSSKPLLFLAVLLGLLLTLEEIALEPITAKILKKSIYSLIAIGGGYLVFVFVDVMLIRFFKAISKKTESTLDDTLLSFFHETARIVIILILFVIILDIWEVNIVPLLGALGIGGLAVALALQPVLTNIFSGLFLVLDKTIKVGDIVKLDSGEIGEIYKIGLRSTRLKTFDNEMIIIPNSQLANSKVQNFLQPDPSIRVNFDFGVEYGVDPEYIKRIVIEEIEKIEVRKKDEEIRVLFLNMGDNALLFKVMFWVDDISKKWPAHQEALSRIYRRLYDEGIGIPFPQRTVWLRKDEGKAPTPKDPKFKKVRDKYYPWFGHEMPANTPEEPKEKEKTPKRRGFFKNLRIGSSRERKTNKKDKK